MRWKDSLLLVLLLAGILSVTSPAFSDTLHLKNGKSIKCSIVSESAKGVVVAIGGGTINFTRDEIDRIDRGSPSTEKKRKLVSHKRKPKEKEV